MNEHSAPLFRVAYRMQCRDHVARIVALRRRPPAVALAAAALYAALLLALLLLRTGTPADLAAELRRLLTTDAILGVLPFLLPGLLLLVPAAAWAALLGGLAYRRSGLAGASVTLDLTADGITATVASEATRHPWSAVRRLFETADYLFLQLSRREALIIPRAAVGDPADYDRLVGFIRARTGLPTRR